MKKSFTVILLIVMTILLHGQDQIAIERIPFELKGEYVIIKIIANASDTLDCLFDTGATSSIMVLNKRAAESMKLSYGKSVKAMGGGGSVNDAKKIKGNSLKISSIELKNITFYCISLEQVELESGIKIDCILGDIILSRYVAKVNYDTNQIELYSNKGFSYQGKGVKIPIKTLPVLNLGYLNGSVEFDDGSVIHGKYLIDSGAAHALIFSTPFAQKNNLKTKFPKLVSYGTKGLSDDQIEMNLARLKRFIISEIDFNSIPVSLSNVEKGVLSWKKFSGILGNKILMKYNITYNYKRKVTFWELNQYTDLVIKTNCTGFEVAYTDKLRTKIIINQLSNDSPAQRAGLNIDDEVISINKQNAYEIGVLGIHQMLQENNKEFEIQVKRKGEVYTLYFSSQQLL